MTSLALAPRESSTLAPGASASLAQFIDAMMAVPAMTPAAEREAVRRMRAGDKRQGRQLVLANMRHVIHVARSYAGYGLPLSDLIQEGSIGLLRALPRFDPKWGVRLITYALHWIRASMLDYILRNFRIVRGPLGKAQRKLFFNLRRMRRDVGHLGHDEAAAIARALGVREDEVRRGRDLFAHDCSLSGSPDAGQARQEWLPAEADPAAEVEAADWDEKTRALLRPALGSLPVRTRAIIERRVLAEAGTGDGLQDLGRRYGVSAERVRQIESDGYRLLRQQMVGPGGDLKRMAAA